MRLIFGRESQILEYKKNSKGKSYQDEDWYIEEGLPVSAQTLSSDLQEFSAYIKLLSMAYRVEYDQNQNENADHA